jgi:hypothetical protein
MYKLIKLKNIFIIKIKFFDKKILTKKFYILIYLFFNLLKF